MPRKRKPRDPLVRFFENQRNRLRGRLFGYRKKPSTNPDDPTDLSDKADTLTIRK